MSDDRSPFDSKVTFLYKKAHGLNTITKFVYINPTTGEYGSYVDLVHSLMPTLDIIKLYAHIRNLNLDLTPIEYAFLYTYFATTIHNMKMGDCFGLVSRFYAYANNLPENRGRKIQVQSNDTLFSSNFNRWVSSYTSIIKEESAIYQTIIDNQEKLSSTEPLVTSAPVIDMSILVYSPTWINDVPVEIPDGIDVFGSMEASQIVPFVHYVDDAGTSRYWIAKSTPETGFEAPYSIIDQVISQSVLPNQIGMIVCILPKVDASTIFTRESFVRVLYSLKSGTITIPTPSTTEENKNYMRDRVQAAFPLLKLGESRETRVRGHFMIEGLEVTDASLHMTLLNHPVFSTYLTIEESEGSRAEKTRLNLHYRAVGSEFKPKVDSDVRESTASSVNISFGKPITEELVDLIPGAFESQVDQNEESRKSLRVNVIHAKSTEILTQFINIFSRLMRIYVEGDYNRNCINIFSNLIEGYTQEEEDYDDEGEGGSGTLSSVTSKSAGSKRENRDRKIKRLRGKFPDIFPSDYARKCSCPHQPILIPADEIGDWQQQTFVDKTTGLVTARPVMAFPPPRTPEDVPAFYAVCPSDMNPYPALRSTLGLANSIKYPYLPCCASRLQNPNKQVKMYYEALSNPDIMTQPKETTKEGYRINTHKYLDPGRTAKLPSKFVDLLRSTSSTENMDFVRMGIPNTNNSLIHCALQAIQFAPYLALGHDDREAYAIYVRLKGLSTIHPGVYKQELYDLSNEDIASRIVDTSVYLDPYLFYRGVEEYFGINIFVFNFDGPINPITGINDKETEMCIETPRCRMFSTRVFRERPSIVIIKHWGSESNPFNRTHCELVVSLGQIAQNKIKIEEDDCDACSPVDSDGLPASGSKNVISPIVTIGQTNPVGYGVAPIITSQPMYRFDNEMNEVMHQVLMMTMRPLNFMFPWNKEQQWSGYNVITRSDPYGQIDWLSILEKHTIVGQRVDAYGKLRVLGIKVQDEEGKEGVVTIYVPPSQPLNLPYLERYTFPREDTVISLLGQPTGQHTDGLWFNILDAEMPFGVFAPCERTMATSTLPEGPPAPISYEEEEFNYMNPITEMRNMKRYASIFMQLMMWLWYLGEDEERPPLDEWYVKYVRLDESEGMIAPGDKSHPPTLYRHQLPNAENTEGGLAILAQEGWWPQYFRKDGIYMYRSLWEICYGFMKYNEKVTFEDPRLTLPTHLDGLFMYEDDFPKKKGAVVFIDTKHLTSWIKSQIGRGVATSSILPILHKLEISMAFTTEPYLYKDPSTSKVYIVQNVRNGDKLRAMSVITNWYTLGRNTGYDTPAFTGNPNVMQVVYAINISGDMAVFASNVPEMESYSYYQFLRYTRSEKAEIFAALIPLV